MKTVDCRGLNCPEPVLRTKKTLTEHPDDEICVIVDSDTARENVLRFARSRGREVSFQQSGDAFNITITAKTKFAEDSEATGNKSEPHEGAVLLITSDLLGQGSSELGQLLMRNFLYTLQESERAPRAVIFMNSGVKLCISGSAVIEELLALLNRQVTILVCGTCLDYYRLKDKHAAGQVSNMYDITDLLINAQRVISI